MKFCKILLITLRNKTIFKNRRCYTPLVNYGIYINLGFHSIVCFCVLVRIPKILKQRIFNFLQEGGVAFTAPQPGDALNNICINCQGQGSHTKLSEQASIPAVCTSVLMIMMIMKMMMVVMMMMMSTTTNMAMLTTNKTTTQ